MSYQHGKTRNHNQGIVVVVVVVVVVLVVVVVVGVVVLLLLLSVLLLLLLLLLPTTMPYIVADDDAALTSLSPLPFPHRQVVGFVHHLHVFTLCQCICTLQYLDILLHDLFVHYLSTQFGMQSTTCIVFNHYPTHLVPRSFLHRPHAMEK